MLLVRVDPWEESETLQLHELDVDVLRVRYALPACERMRVVRPAVVIVGNGVLDADLDLLQEVAHQVGCATLDIGAYVSKDALRGALRRAIARGIAMRAARKDDDLPEPKRGSARRSR